MLFSAGASWDCPPAASILSSICAGLVLVRMFVIYHDYQHHSILRKSASARIIFTWFGLHILAAPNTWKRSHDSHRTHNSQLFGAGIGSFSIYTRQKFLKASTSERRAYLASRHPLTIALAYATMLIYGMCIRSFLRSPRRHYDSLIALILHGVLGVSLAAWLGWQALLLSIIVPFSIASGFGAYLFYTRHNFPGATFRGTIEWSYDHAALQSSSSLAMNPFWRWVTANIGYHHIHHPNSRIPFYRLPEAMDKVPELQKANTTSLSPADIVRCLRLKG